MSASFLLRLRADSNGIVDLAGNTFTNYNVTYTNDGKFSGVRALTFAANGSKSMLQTGTAFGKTLGTDDFTISYWLKARTNLPEDGLQVHISQVQTGNDHSDGEFAIQSIESLGMWSCLQIWLNNTWTAISAMPFDDISAPMPTWHHVAYTRKNGVIYGFSDGTLTQSLSFNSAVIDPALKLSLGDAERYWSSSDNYFDGSIDDICIIKGAALWTANFTPPTYYLSLQKYLFIDENRAVWGQA